MFSSYDSYLYRAQLIRDGRFASLGMTNERAEVLMKLKAEAEQKENEIINALAKEFNIPASEVIRRLSEPTKMFGSEDTQGDIRNFLYGSQTTGIDARLSRARANKDVDKAQYERDKEQYRRDLAKDTVQQIVQKGLLSFNDIDEDVLVEALMNTFKSIRAVAPRAAKGYVDEPLGLLGDKILISRAKNWDWDTFINEVAMSELVRQSGAENKFFFKEDGVTIKFDKAAKRYVSTSKKAYVEPVADITYKLTTAEQGQKNEVGSSKKYKSSISGKKEFLQLENKPLNSMVEELSKDKEKNKIFKIAVINQSLWGNDDFRSRYLSKALQWSGGDVWYSDYGNLSNAKSEGITNLDESTTLTCLQPAITFLYKILLKSLVSGFEMASKNLLGNGVYFTTITLKNDNVIVIRASEIYQGMLDFITSKSNIKTIKLTTTYGGLRPSSASKFALQQMRVRSNTNYDNYMWDSAKVWYEKIEREMDMLYKGITIKTTINYGAMNNNVIGQLF